MRIWKTPRSRESIAAKRGVPLQPGEEEDLIFYFPMDEVGMETGHRDVTAVPPPRSSVMSTLPGRLKPHAGELRSAATRPPRRQAPS